MNKVDIIKSRILKINKQINDKDNNIRVLKKQIRKLKSDLKSAEAELKQEEVESVMQEMDNAGISAADIIQAIKNGNIEKTEFK